MLSVSVRLESAWNDWNAPFGFGYHLLLNLGNELMRGTAEDAKRLLTDRCGNAREKMFDQLSQRHLHKLFSDSARDIKSWTRSSFAKGHYEEFGLIVTDLRRADLEPIIGENMSEGWRGRDAPYRKLKDDTIAWEAALKQVETKVGLICDRIFGSQPDDQKRVYLPDELKGWRANIKGVMAARWILFTLEKYEPDINRRMYLLGWLRSLNAPETEIRESWGAYRAFFFERGLLFPDKHLASPYCFLWQEEKDWRDRYHPPK